MKLFYFGHSCFKLEFARNAVVVTDPFTGVGYEMPTITADIVTCSHQHFDHNFTQRVSCNRTPIGSSGSYSFFAENGTLLVEGIDCFHDEQKGALRGNNVIFKFTYGNLVLCHMGDIGEPPSDKLISQIGKVDVLMIPVGGTYTVDAQGAREYVEKLSPSVVIPMHYKFGTCNLDIAGVDEFTELSGRYTVERGGQSIEINKEQLSEKTKKIIVMAGACNE